MLSLILYYIDEEYRNLHPYLSTRNDDFKVSSDILNLASKNKVLHAFLKGVLNEGIDTPKVRSELSYCERQLVKLTDTLQFISGLLGDNGIDFLTIKTFKGGLHQHYHLLNLDCLHPLVLQKLIIILH